MNVSVASATVETGAIPPVEVAGEAASGLNEASGTTETFTHPPVDVGGLAVSGLPEASAIVDSFLLPAIDIFGTAVSGLPEASGSALVLEHINISGEALSGLHLASGTLESSGPVEAQDLTPVIGYIDSAIYSLGEDAYDILPIGNGGNGELTYSIIGDLPPGLRFNARTREVTGRPTTMGVYTVLYRVTDEDGDFMDQTWHIAIGPAP